MSTTGFVGAKIVLGNGAGDVVATLFDGGDFIKLGNGQASNTGRVGKGGDIRSRPDSGPYISETKIIGFNPEEKIERGRASEHIFKISLRAVVTYSSAD